MITYREDVPVEVAGRTITLIARIQINVVQHGATLVATASKSPAAVRIKDGESETLFILDPDWHGASGERSLS